MIFNRFTITCFFVLFLSCIKMYALDYYWVGGNGSWSQYSTHWATSSGGTTFHTQVPTPSDNVYIDPNSFTSSSGTITLDQTVITCNSFIFSTGTKAITIAGGTSSTSLNIYGDLQFAPGVSVSYAGNIIFKAAGGPNIFTQNGAILNSYYGSFIIDSPSDTLIISDSLSVNEIQLLNGGLNASGKTIACSSFTSANSNVRSLDITSSKIKIYYSWTLITTNLTAQLAGAKFNCIGSVTFDSEPNAQNYDTLILTKGKFYTDPRLTGVFNAGVIITDSIDAVTFEGQIVVDKLLSNSGVLDILNGPVYIKKSSFTNLQMITLRSNLQLDSTDLSGGSCSAFLKIYGYYPVEIIKTSGILSLDYVYLQNVTATGGASFVANNVIDMGGNSGWTMKPYDSVNLYWIGGSGNWIDGSKWSFTSGGTPAYCIPTPYNDAIFDANSFTADGQKVVMGGAVCRSLNFKACTFKPWITGSLNIYGSILLRPQMNLSGLGGLTFSGSSNDNIIDFAGNSYNWDITINCNGSYTLSDSINAQTFYFQKGTLNTNGKKVSCSTFDSQLSIGSRVLKLGNSQIVVQANFNIAVTSSAPLSFFPDSSEIIIYRANSISIANNLKFNDFKVYSTSSYTIWGNNLSFNNAYFYNIGTIWGSNTYDTLGVSSGNGLIFNNNTTQTFNQLTILNPSCSITELVSNGSGSVNFVKSSGNLILQKVSLKNIHASGGATFNAINSLDLGGNSGWNISNASFPDLFWIGGTGNWSDPLHWSYTSGGTPSGCTPSQTTNVIFDENSFAAREQVVTIDVAFASCKSMTWKNLSYFATLSGSSITLYGSLILHEKLNLKLISVSFKNSDPILIESNSVFFPYVYCNGNDSIIFNDNFNAVTLTLQTGIINFNKKNFSLGTLSIGNGSSLNLNIDSSEVNAFEQFYITKDSLKLSSKGSVVNIGQNTYGSNDVMIMQNSPDTIFTITLDRVRFIDNNGSSFSGGTNFSVSDVIINRLETDSIYGFQMSCNNITVNEFISQSDHFSISGTNNHFKRAILGSNETVINDDINFDYLKIDPGKTLKIKSGKTIFVSNLLEAPGQPGFPIAINSVTSGSQANISIPTGTFCFDYLYLSDMNATGGATFIAGLNSSNVSNNTGWDFSSSCDLLYATANPDPFCEESTVQLNANGLSASSYSWTGPDGFVSSLQNPTVPDATNSNSGIYEVTAGGKKAQVYVSAVRIPVNVIHKDGDQTIVCVENNANLTYKWYKNDTLLNFDTYSTLGITDSGSYKCQIFTPEGCSVVTNTIVLTAKDLNVPIAPDQFTVNAISSSEIKLNWKDNSNNELSFVIERSLSDTGGFLNITFVNANIISYNDKGLLPNTTYYYRIKATNALGNSPYSAIADATTLDITSINEPQKDYLKIFPNPTQGDLYISCNSFSSNSSSSNILIKIYNDQGRVMMKYEGPGNYSENLDLSSWNKGIYLVQVVIGEDVQYRKIVVE